MRSSILLSSGLAGAVVLGVWCAWPAAGQGPPRPAPGSNAPGAKSADLFLGVASCASMACHHGNGPRGSVRSEYTTWATLDPHARAYEVLFSERSKRMAKLLKRPQPPHQDRVCLNCHVQPDYAEAEPRHGPRFAKEDGVGCETCHGPAQRWLASHHAWGQRDVAFKVAQGMRDVWTLAGRARLCVACHVGSPTAEVNHDLIAAGHPRLKFEFAAYHAVWPRHWPDARDFARQGRPDFEAAAWLVGQGESARAALELLAARARGGPGRVWPEFAEYDCFACHHDLQAPSWRQKRDAELPGGGKRPLGSAPWGTWYFATPARLAGRVRGGADFRASLTKLERLMADPEPGRQEVAAQAKAVLARLPAFTDALPRGNAAGIRDLFVRLTGPEEARRAAANWDAAVQSYLGLAALHHAWKDAAPATCPPPLKARLGELGQGLRFRPGHDSPAAFTPDALPGSFGRLRQALGAGKE